MTGISTATAGQQDRAYGALLGLALGDALGMPTQSMSPTEIADDYGWVGGLIAAGPRQEIARGMTAGSITDDTEQTLLLADLLISGRGVVDPHDFATALLGWEQRMAAKGSLDLLGPSTRAAVQRIVEGVSAAESGRHGSTNGAAMRIAPVGISRDNTDLPAFVDAVVAASAVTHNTTIGIAAAAAVGAAVSAGVGGASADDAIAAGLAAARLGERHGYWVAGGSIAGRTEFAVSLLRTAPGPAAQVAVLRDVVGTSVASQESVVAALALVAVSTDPWQTLTVAANLGGDTDTIAAIAGAILGAVHGAAVWPAEETRQLLMVNGLDLESVAAELLSLRAT